MEVQMHFEFNQWKEAFQKWRECVPIYGDTIRFLISMAPYVSGYWIESVPDNPLELNDKSIIVYTGEQVAALEQKILSEIERADKSGGSPRFIK